LDAKRKKELKEMLLEMKARKLEEIQHNHADKESINSFQNDAGDFADSASNIYEKELHMDLSEKNKKMLMEIEEALSKIENGSYGKCERCGEDISIERLKAIPFAKRCIKCERSMTK
jgi:DnaK suppressor protein